jgi:hypothetical protein
VCSPCAYFWPLHRVQSNSLHSSLTNYTFNMREGVTPQETEKAPEGFSTFGHFEIWLIAKKMRPPFLGR